MINKLLNLFGYEIAPRIQRQPAQPERWDFQGCVCSPGREMELAAEEERHYQAVERIRQLDLQEAIAAYHGRTTQQQPQPLPSRQLPIPAPRRTVPQLPQPTQIEVSNDGLHWFTIEVTDEQLLQRH